MVLARMPTETPEKIGQFETQKILRYICSYYSLYLLKHYWKWWTLWFQVSWSMNLSITFLYGVFQRKFLKFDLSNDGYSNLHKRIHFLFMLRIANLLCVLGIDFVIIIKYYKCLSWYTQHQYLDYAIKYYCKKTFECIYLFWLKGIFPIFVFWAA